MEVEDQTDTKFQELIRYTKKAILEPAMGLKESKIGDDFMPTAFFFKWDPKEGKFSCEIVGLDFKNDIAKTNCAIRIRQLAKKWGSDAIVILTDSFFWDVDPEVAKQKLGVKDREEFHEKWADMTHDEKCEVADPVEQLQATIDCKFTDKQWHAKHTYKRDQGKIVWLDPEYSEHTEMRGRFAGFFKDMDEVIDAVGMPDDEEGAGH